MHRLAALASTTLAAVYVACSVLILTVHAFDRLSKTNVVNYWGQNTVSFSGGTEGRLSDYCQDDNVNVLVISFIYQIEKGIPILNLSKHCTDKYPGTPHLRCPEIEQDIQACQARGKAVLVSIGGATGSHSIQDPAHGRALADQVWQLFLGGSHATRPFGKAVLNGIDLDLESGQNAGYVEFARVLRTKHFVSSNQSHPYLITAAPQCPFPDQAMKDILASSFLDLVFVQFYNNYCGVQSYGTTSFNFASWNQWATSSSVNKHVRVLLGVPGGPGATGSGIIESAQLNTILTDLTRYDHFGGVMMWDAGVARKSGLAAAVMAHLRAHARTGHATVVKESLALPTLATATTVTATTATVPSFSSCSKTATVTITATTSIPKPTKPKSRPVDPTPQGNSIMAADRHRHGDRPSGATSMGAMERDYLGQPIKKGSPKWTLKRPHA